MSVAPHLRWRFLLLASLCLVLATAAHSLSAQGMGAMTQLSTESDPPPAPLQFVTASARSVAAPSGLAAVQVLVTNSNPSAIFLCRVTASVANESSYSDDQYNRVRRDLAVPAGGSADVSMTLGVRRIYNARLWVTVAALMDGVPSNTAVFQGQPAGAQEFIEERESDLSVIGLPGSGNVQPEFAVRTPGRMTSPFPLPLPNAPEVFAGFRSIWLHDPDSLPAADIAMLARAARSGTGLVVPVDLKPGRLPESLTGLLGREIGPDAVRRDISAMAAFGASPGPQYPAHVPLPSGMHGLLQYATSRGRPRGSPVTPPPYQAMVVYSLGMGSLTVLDEPSLVPNPSTDSWVFGVTGFPVTGLTHGIGVLEAVTPVTKLQSGLLVLLLIAFAVTAGPLAAMYVRKTRPHMLVPVVVLLSAVAAVLMVVGNTIVTETVPDRSDLLVSWHGHDGKPGFLTVDSSFTHDGLSTLRVPVSSSPTLYFPLADSTVFQQAGDTMTLAGANDVLAHHSLSASLATVPTGGKRVSLTLVGDMLHNSGEVGISTGILTWTPYDESDSLLIPPLAPGESVKLTPAGIIAYLAEPPSHRHWNALRWLTTPSEPSWRGRPRIASEGRLADWRIAPVMAALLLEQPAVDHPIPETGEHEVRIIPGACVPVRVDAVPAWMHFPGAGP